MTALNLTYVRFELKRLVRNKRMFILSIIMPVALYVLIGLGNKHQNIDLGRDRLNFQTFYMVSMAGYGAMLAALGAGARVAIDRSAGWNRQLRLTPLSQQTYFGVKVLCGLLLACTSIALLYAIGIATGVSLASFSRWAGMTALIVAAVFPFIAIGTWLGHVLGADSIGPAIGGGGALFGFLGGQWFPPPEHGFLHYVSESVPSYLMTQAGHVGIGGASWPLQGWLVIAAWTVVFGLLTARAYVRDTARTTA